MMDRKVQRNSALLLLPKARGAESTGDQVVLRHLVHFLQERFRCQTVSFERLGGIRKLFNIVLRGVPLELSPYWSRQYKHEVATLLKSTAFDEIFILHEGLFYLADEIDCKNVRVTLFAHNMLSRFSIDSVFQPILTLLARRYERRWYGKDGTRLVLISKGDRDEAVKLGIVGNDAPVACPGAPKAIDLAETATFTGEAVITGSHAWWRKRHDLKSFAELGAKLKPLIAFDPIVARFLSHAVVLPSLDALDWSSSIRLGVITDRFAGGFKLKSLEYVARNCIIFSRAPLFEEFQDLPHAREFVVDRIEDELWIERILELRNKDSRALRARFLEFKLACLVRHDWATCLDSLVPSDF